MSGAFAMVVTSVAGRDDARAIAALLVERRLSACVQASAVESTYRWKEGVETAAEIVLAAKIRAEDFAAAEAAIRAAHPYDVPEIVMIPIAAGHRRYLDWLEASTRRDG